MSEIGRQGAREVGSPPSQGATDSSIRVVLAMDQEYVRDSFSRALTSYPGGTVTFVCADSDEAIALSERERPHVVISVADQGCGIDEDHLPRIFERFYRVDKARSRARGGAGLGLSIVQTIATQHGGTTSADSVEGEGTVVRIVLPRARG